MTPDEMLDLCARTADAVRAAVATIDPVRMTDPGVRDGQYHLDLIADAAALAVLHPAGVKVISEESGHTGDPDAEITVVLDPVDGSTNCSHGIPMWAIAIGVADADGPAAGYVRNQATGVTWTATRGNGAYRDGVQVHASGAVDASRAIVTTEGIPSPITWWQTRAFGSAALDLCMVADGTVDGAVLPCGIYVWDYLGALVICAEGGAVVDEATGLSLPDAPITEKRYPFAAATPELLEVLRPAAGA